MEAFTTYGKQNQFVVDFSDYQGDELDNAEALGLRFTLVIVEEGTGIAYIDDKPTPYIAPCVFCLQETEHCVIKKDKNCKVKAIFFHPNIIYSAFNFDNVRNYSENESMTMTQDREMFRYFLIRDKKYMGKMSLGPITGKRISSIWDAVHKQSHEQPGENWSCRSRSFLMEMMIMLENLYEAGLYENESSLDTIQETFQPILLYIYNNYEKKMTVTEITEHFHISRTTFAQMFQKNVGESFLTYLNKLRINIAATMLRDTMLPVSEIMYRVGMSDQVHFLRTFKKYNGITPTAYREKYNWM